MEMKADVRMNQGLIQAGKAGGSQWVKMTAQNSQTRTVSPAGPVRPHLPKSLGFSSSWTSTVRLDCTNGHTAVWVM